MGRLAGPGQVLERAPGAMHHVADAADVEDVVADLDLRRLVGVPVPLVVVVELLLVPLELALDLVQVDLAAPGRLGIVGIDDINALIVR